MMSEQDHANTTSNRPHLGLILCTLRVTVALQCIGNWRWLIHIEETPLLHWLLSPADVGGLAWSEQVALAAQQTAGWLVLLAAPAVLWRPHVLVLAPLVLLQTLITVAMWQTAEGYAMQASWAPPQLLTLFPFLTQAVRMAAPLGLLLLSHRGLHAAPSGRAGWGGRSLLPLSPLRLPSSRRTIAVTMQLFRWATAIVFFAHGMEAWQHNPKFVDLLINFTQFLLGTRLTQTAAQQCLTAIGGVDMLLALTCVSFRWLPVLGWMAIWGGATAIIRVASNGWEMSGHEALIRIPHLGVPLAVALWWHLLKYERATAATVDNDRITTSEQADSRNSKKNDPFIT